jgi:hypothetical protein
MNTIKNLFPEELHKYLPTIKSVLHSVVTDHVLLIKVAVETSGLDEEYKRRLLGYLEDSNKYFDGINAILVDSIELQDIILELKWDKTSEGYDFWFEVMKMRLPVCIDSLKEVHKTITSKVQDLCNNAESGETVTFSEPVYYNKKDYECTVTCYVRYNSATETEGGFISGSFKENFEVEIESAILTDEDGNEIDCRAIVGSID